MQKNFEQAHKNTNMAEHLLVAVNASRTVGDCAVQFIGATNTFIREGRLCYKYPNSLETTLRESASTYNAFGTDSDIINRMIGDLDDLGASVAVIKRVKKCIDAMRCKDLAGVRMLLFAAALIDHVESLLANSALVGTPEQKDVLKTLLTFEDLDVTFLENQPADTKTWLYGVFCLDDAMPTTDAFMHMLAYRNRVWETVG